MNPARWGEGLARLAQAAAGADPVTWIDVVRKDVAPVASAYVAVLAMLIAFGRGRRSGRPPVATRRLVRPFTGRGRSPSWGLLVRYILETTVGGYALFLLIVVTFYFVLGGEDRTFIWQALGEGSLLAFAIVVPGFLLISWVHGRPAGRRHGARGGRAAGAATPPPRRDAR